MSKALSATIRCTRCRASQTIQIWESVTANRRPDLKEKVLDGSIFRHECARCATVITVTHPLLYHDPDDQLACWLCDGSVTRELEDAMDSFGFTLPKSYRLRLVYTSCELAEKVRIFDHVLNDWFVHLLKMHLAQQSQVSSSELSFLRGTIGSPGYTCVMQTSDGNTVTMSNIPRVRATC